MECSKYLQVLQLLFNTFLHPRLENYEFKKLLSLKHSDEKIVKYKVLYLFEYYNYSLGCFAICSTLSKIKNFIYNLKS